MYWKSAHKPVILFQNIMCAYFVDYILLDLLLLLLYTQDSVTVVVVIS